jgi:hypothetical protein
MRAYIIQRDKWTQIRIGACALLFPPLTLGAAFYSMLAITDDSASRPPSAAAGAQVTRPEFLRDTQAPAVSANQRPLPQATEPITSTGNPAPADRVSVSATGTRQQPRSAEEMARVLNPIPVPVTVVRPTGVSPPSLEEIGGAPTGGLAREPSSSAPAEMSTALLPRALMPPGKVLPQIPQPQTTTQIPAAQAPSVADPPSAAGPPAPLSTAPKHPRSEAIAARRNARSQRQHEFSLKNWLQQLGILQRNTRG